MKAENICQRGLFSVEQQNFLASQPDIMEYYFSDQLGNAKIDETYTQKLTEWQNLKFFKH